MTPPSVSTLVLSVATATLAAMFVVAVATDRESGAGSEQPCPITGLVLDGGQVTTTAPVSSARRPVEPIPWRELGAPTITTTEKEQRCG